MSKISFIKSDNRKYNIERSLSLIKSEIMNGLKNAKQVVVKPSCIVENNNTISTNVDALETLLDFIKPYTSSQITIAEGVINGKTINAFKNYKYFNLQEKYDFTTTDLNQDLYDEIELIDKRGSKFKIKIAKTILESDYLISIAPPKTHEDFLFSGAIENIVTGSISKEPVNFLSSKFMKPVYHKFGGNQDYKTINLNTKTVFDKIPLKLAVIDGYSAFEGDGPISGQVIPTHFALASSDPLAADWLASKLMGIDFENIKYLSLIDDAEVDKTDFFVVGDNWQKNLMRFRLPDKFKKISG